MIEVYARKDLEGPLLPKYGMETNFYDEALSHYRALLGNEELLDRGAKIVLLSAEDPRLTRSCWLASEAEVAAETQAFMAMAPRMGD